MNTRDVGDMTGAMTPRRFLVLRRGERSSVGVQYQSATPVREPLLPTMVLDASVYSRHGDVVEDALEEIVG